MGGSDDGAARTRLLRDPDGGAPSGTSIRFAVLVLTITASTGSIFGYLWQLSRPDQQARVRDCIAALSHGRLPRIISALNAVPLSKAVLLRACMRPVGLELTTWFLGGVGLLAILTIALYAITPWWIIHAGRLGGRRLTPLDPAQRPELTSFLADLVARVGPPGPPAFLIDTAAAGTAGGQAFGHQRRTYIRLDLGLVSRYPANRARLTDVVLHELAHLRNQDNRPTYLTISAWRAFAVLIPAGYLWVLLTSPPSVPDPGILVAVPALVALVLLSTRAVLRVRELHADATAAFYHPDGTLRTVLAAAQAPGPPRWRRLLRYHPDPRHRAAALVEPGRLFRADFAAAFSAGAAIAITISDMTVTTLGAVLASPLLSSSSLAAITSGNHPLLLALATFGPPALLGALAVVALSCAMAWRLRYRSLVDGTAAPIAGLGAATAAGLLAGGPVSFNDAVAGTWGALDTSVTRDLIVAVLSLALLACTLTILNRWAAECAAAWFTRGERPGRGVRAAALIAGALGFAPVLYAWDIVHEVALNLQILRGPARAERPLVGGWPGSTAVFAHYSPLGLVDTVPGYALLLALPCLLVAAGQVRRTPPAPRPSPLAAAGPRPRVPVRAAAAAGLAGAAVSLALALALIWSLRAVIGGHAIGRAGGFGLEYLTRVIEAVVAICAATAGALVARWATGTRLTTAILTALITATGAAVFIPQILYVGELGWPHKPVNPVDNHVLFGLVGNMGPARAVVATIAFLAAVATAARLATALRRLAGRAAPGTAPAAAPPAAPPAAQRPAAAPRLPSARHAAARLRAPWHTASLIVTVYSITLLVVGLAVAAYYYLTLGLSFRSG
jgi:Zn-dependent protease with chaperone function